MLGFVTYKTLDHRDVYGRIISYSKESDLNSCLDLIQKSSDVIILNVIPCISTILLPDP